MLLFNNIFYIKKGENIVNLLSKKNIKICLTLMGLAIIAPIILGKLGFYGESFAAQKINSPRQHAARISYADAVIKAAPGVVSIQTTKEIPLAQNPLMQDPFFRFFFGDQGMGQGMVPEDRIQQGLGSGVIIDPRGYVVTNNHVIRDTDTVKVKLSDGRTSEAKIIGVDSNTDLAVLKIDLKDLPAVTLGTSSDLRVGDIALAIGNPFGLDRTVTQGIISATGSLSERSKDKSPVFAGYLDNLIQTDAAINPGNSGGALIDSNGDVIGINMAILSRSGGSQGIGFAIPIDLAKNIVKQLIDNGEIIRGWIGIHLGEISEEIKKYLNYDKDEGVYVQATVNNSPAQKAGILPGDIITKINGTAIKNMDQTLRLVGDLKPNNSYPIEVFRRGETLNFSVLIKQRPKGR